MLYYVDLLCAVLVRTINIIFHVLPSHFVLWFGRQIGVLVYLIKTPRRKIGYANIRAAYCREKTPHEIKRLLINVYKNLAQTFCEILSLTKLDKEYIKKYIKIEGRAHFEKVTNNPEGTILLTAHFDNWELAGMVSALEGFPLTVLAREQKMKKLNELIMRLRESKGLTVVRKGVTTRYIVKALHHGRTIGMVGDQDAGKTGVFINFFDRPASTAPGSIRIAAKTGATILPCFMQRTGGPNHKLIIEKPIKVHKRDHVEPHLEKYNALLEKYVRQYPEQWLWLHKRWKSTPVKKVVIISDGKPGHVNQAKAVAKELVRYREKSGFSPDDTHVETVEIKFKNRFSKTLLNLLSLFSTGSCQGCMKCMKACLAKESYDDLMKRFADIVISCGSGVAGVNRLFSLENNAKSAVVMKPSILGFNKFHMVVLPRHDATGRERAHVVVGDTVPNLIDEDYLKESSQKLKERIKSHKRKKIGVLLGGNNDDFELTREITNELVKNVVDAARKLDAEILFTTSRRTPKESQDIVKDALRREKRCSLLLLANERNIDDAVGGILGLSDVIVVSGESASMVSEAIYSGKNVIAFGLKPKRKKRSKFHLMLDNLKRHGHIIVGEPNELSDIIYTSGRTTRKQSVPKDRHNVYMHMWRLGI